MINQNLTTRIGIRCTTGERDRIHSIADSLGLTTTDFLREAAIIALAKTADRASWRRTYERAITNVSEKKLWNTL